MEVQIGMSCSPEMLCTLVKWLFVCLGIALLGGILVTIWREQKKSQKVNKNRRNQRKNN